MKKKLIALLIVLTTVLILIPVGVFAYFSITSNEKTIEINHNFSNDVIEIEDYSELLLYSKEHNYNDLNDIEELNSNPLVNSAARKTLKFNSDITLIDNIYFTANVSLDLNGHSLSLNGYDIIFNYGYLANAEIYSSNGDGYIIPNKAEDLQHNGFIYFFTNNNVLLEHKNLKAKSTTGNNLTLANYIKTLNYSERYYSYDIFKMIGDVLQDGYYQSVDRLSYTALDDNASITTNENVLVFNSNLFIKNYLNFDVSTLNGTVSFVTKNIDLPIYYLNNKDIEIVYESSDEAVLDNTGKVLDNTQNKIVTLTANVKVAGEVVSKCEYYLYVFDNESNAVYKVIKACLSSYLLPHYDSNSGYYIFNREIVLPKKIFDNDISYLPYRLSNADNAIKLFDDSNDKFLSLGTGNVVSIDDYIYSFIPTTETRALSISFGETLNIRVSSSNLVVNNETSIARALINDWYGGSIILNKNGEDNYDSQTLYSNNDIDSAVYPNVELVGYEIINDTYGLYQLSDLLNGQKVLSVVSGKAPEEFVQNAVLSIELTVDSADVNIQLQIGVKTPSEETQNAFLPYYTYFDDLIKTGYNYYIDGSFELPFSYNNVGPIVVYDFVLLPKDYEDLANQHLNINTADTNIFKIELYYNGAVGHTFTFSSGESYASQMNSFLGLDYQSKLQEILSYGDAKYKISLIKENLKSENLRIGIVYNYKANATTSSWLTYCKNTTNEQIVSKITVTGILKLNTDVYDEVFYKWIYDKFNNLNDTYTAGDYDDNDKVILVDWLNQNIAVDAKTDSAIASVTDFRGLKYLKATKYLRLVNNENQGLITNVDAAITIAREIAEMSNLETLILSNCTGFTDGKDKTSSVDNDNDSISRFVNLKKLKYLDLSGCNILLFNFLESMTWLNEVYIYDQVISKDANYNYFYGNEGIVNYQIFGDLTDAGVKVYNTFIGTAPKLLEHDKNVNDYIRIRNGIIYQSMLKNNVDIRNLFNDFSTTPSDYNLANSYGSLNVTSKNISFEALVNDGETYLTAKAFIAKYTFTLTGNITVNLRVKFNVERY